MDWKRLLLLSLLATGTAYAGEEEEEEEFEEEEVVARTLEVPGGAL